MPITLIEQNPSFDKKVEHEGKLAIAEMFCDTLQGEGVSVGVPSTFVRLQGCTLKCKWCDTLDVWPNGNEYSYGEIFDKFDSVGLIKRFRQGQHLILTGGSPLKQQSKLIDFLKEFSRKYGFIPYIEVENESVLMPNGYFTHLVNQWNNSPKLNNSGMKRGARIKPAVLTYLSGLKNSWFKFVISKEEDWDEIRMDFIDPGYVKKEQIILMPEGDTQEKLNTSRIIAADLAIANGVRFTDRLHVTLWNKKTGV